MNSPTMSAETITRFVEKQMKDTFVKNMNIKDATVKMLLEFGPSNDLLSTIMQFVTDITKPGAPPKTTADILTFVFDTVLGSRIAPAFPATPATKDIKVNKLLSSPALKIRCLRPSAFQISTSAAQSDAPPDHPRPPKLKP